MLKSPVKGLMDGRADLQDTLMLDMSAASMSYHMRLVPLHDLAFHGAIALVAADTMSGAIRRSNQDRSILHGNLIPGCCYHVSGQYS